ncbi:MAG: GNAT family N-acetyltransferase [Planctomycetota bacterium]|nr:GNAT family N-acetyltransferase [Planctomycetota bacterium]
MSEVPPYTIREYQPGDEEAILETFNRVFSGVDPNFVPRTMREWRWTYLDNPSGWRISLAVTEDGRVISQYAGIAQRMLLDGEPAHFSQAVDSMTDPTFRRGLKRPGFFVLTGYPYAEGYGGAPPDKDTVMWGLPVPPAWRIGKQYLKYELVRTQLKLCVAPAALVLPGVGSHGVVVEELEPERGFPEDVGELFAAHAQRHGAMAVRDKAQLDWRYTQRPGYRYRIASARRGGTLVGLTIQRVGGFDGRQDSLVCDWMVGPPVAAGSPFDLGAAVELLAWHKARAIEDGAEQLTALFPDTAPEWLAFQEVGFRAADSSYFLVGRNYVKQYDMRWLRRHWYYTLGDTDLA